MTGVIHSGSVFGTVQQSAYAIRSLLPATCSGYWWLPASDDCPELSQQWQNDVLYCCSLQRGQGKKEALLGICCWISVFYTAGAARALYGQGITNPLPKSLLCSFLEIFSFMPSSTKLLEMLGNFYFCNEVFPGFLSHSSWSVWSHTEFSCS